MKSEPTKNYVNTLIIVADLWFASIAIMTIWLLSSTMFGILYFPILIGHIYFVGNMKKKGFKFKSIG